VTGRIFDNLFIALKSAEACPNERPSIPIINDDELIQSNVHIGKFDETDYQNDNSMLSALKELRYDTGYDIPEKLGGKQVREANERYIERFDPALGYVKSGFGFIKADDLQEFLNQGGERSIGFYVMLGLSNTLSNDRIRIVLIAIDSNGIPLLEDSNKCMEKSWPPII
jgi:hypothetical protein